MAKKKKRNPLPRLPAGSTIVDTHCHLEMTFAETEEMDAAVRRAEALGVCRIITVGIDLPTSHKAIIFASRYESVYATVGIHPHNVQGLDDTSYDELENLCAMPKVVAYGEIGLDYFKQHSPVDQQLEHYARQVELARKVKLPLVIHDREAHNDILAILQKRGPFPAGGVAGKTLLYEK